MNEHYDSFFREVESDSYIDNHNSEAREAIGAIIKAREDELLLRNRTLRSVAVEQSRIAINSQYGSIGVRESFQAPDTWDDEKLLRTSVATLRKESLKIKLDKKKELIKRLLLEVKEMELELNINQDTEDGLTLRQRNGGIILSN